MSTDLEPLRVERTRANALGFGEPGEASKRRRGRIAAGVTLIIVSGWLAAAVFLSVGSREEVLVVARPVDAYAELQRDDLRITRVAADPDVGVVSADRLDDLVGRQPSTALVAGTLLHEDQLVDTGDRLVGTDEAVVGTVLAAGDSPGNLAAGAQVEIVVRAPAGSTAGSQTLAGWVLEVAESDRPGAESNLVSLVVPSDDVALVSAAAAEQRVSVAVLGGS